MRIKEVKDDKREEQGEQTWIGLNRRTKKAGDFSPALLGSLVKKN